MGVVVQPCSKNSNTAGTLYKKILRKRHYSNCKYCPLLLPVQLGSGSLKIHIREDLHFKIAFFKRTVTKAVGEKSVAQFYF